MNLFDLSARITLDSSDYERGVESARGSAKSLAGSIGTGLKTAAKVGVSAISAAASGIAALTGASVKSYAEYEQLVGGVETLFGDGYRNIADYVEKTGKTVEEALKEMPPIADDAYRQVLNNADDAYKNAGMSANEYMETVTGFAASLLQSLGNDTVKAAEYADMAITDMSDNANKMGTNIEMIKNAYGGFAKQNFTMLDNLKLGYGGTQAEMQRLLKDAEKLSGKKFDMSSYADIVDAIHIVQTEMGITGTTAKEASETISGSVSSMKAAWSNLVTGMADDNADIDTLIDNFVESVGIAGKNILPRIEVALSGVGQLIERLAPIIGEALPGVIANAIPALLSAGFELLNGIANGVISALPQITSTAREIVVKLRDGILEGVPVVLESIPSVITGFIDFMTSNFPKIVQNGTEFIGNLAFGIIEGIPNLVSKLPEIIRSFTQFITNNFPVIIKSGAELLGKLAMGILGAVPEMVTHLPDIITAIVEALEAGWQELKNVGEYLLEGLWTGIKEKVGWLKEKVMGVINTIKGWFTGKDGFDEHSPSKWSKQVFQYVMEGGVKGIDAGSPALMRSVENSVGEIQSRMDMGTVKIDFASSGVGMSSAQMINSIPESPAMATNQKIELVLKSSDGQTFGRWLVPFIRSENKSNPEVVSDSL